MEDTEMEEKTVEGGWVIDRDHYHSITKPFVLDVRGKVVCVGDFIIYSQFNKLNVRKVWEIRIKNGRYEVKVCGADGGWKTGFYKLAND